MGKKLFLLFLFFGVFVLGIYLSTFISKTEKKETPKKLEKKQSPSHLGGVIRQKSIFLPYWSIDENEIAVNDYERIIYFGITGTTNGIDKDDAGYTALENFKKQDTRNKQSLLTVRMTNSDVNFSVLQNLDSQEKIIDQAIEIAKEFNFDGVVLDFELFSLFDERVPMQINEFVQRFYKKAKDDNLTFVLTIYGDVFYRKRPYDISTLSKNSDEIMIMAYDFHKSSGEPGPNFPLPEFKTMISDFLKVVTEEKLTLVFGMYGYDWTVDEQKRPLKQASAVTLNQIRDKYLENCSFKNCVVFRDKTSSESEINFVDESGRSHIIWFEDEKSVEEKIKTLQQKNISKVAYWAYGYF